MDRDVEFAFVCDRLAGLLWPERAFPHPPSDLDWERLFRLLTRHRLVGLFYVSALSNDEAWPDSFMKRLRQERYHSLRFGDLYVIHLQRVLAALHEAGVEPLVLKGWALIQQVYGGDHSQRFYDDVDLLVSPNQAARAEGVLQATGYAPQLEEPWPGYHRRYRNSRAFVSSQNLDPYPKRVNIGLHWSLLDTPYYTRRIRVEELFARSQPLTVAGVPVRCLASEDHLIYACGHLALHHTYDEALFRYYELAALILHLHPPMDWQLAIRRASEWRLVIPLQRVSSRIEQLWPKVEPVETGVIPREVQEWIAGLQPTPGERLVHRLVVNDKDNHTLRAGLAWLTLPGLGRRIRFLAETAFPSPAYMRWRYSPAPGSWPGGGYLRRAANAIRHLIKKPRRP